MKFNNSRYRIATLIPAFNEELNIESVVNLVNNRTFSIVVNDGSTDNTELLAISAGAYVVSHEINLGYDAALESGIRTAVSLGMDYVITIDADGQHDPNLIDQFISEINNGADIIVGIRDRKQRWSESLFGLIGKYLWNMPDPLCGMKAYRISLIRNSFLNSYQSIGTEIAIRSSNSGIKIIDLNVKTRPRLGDSRFGSGITANFRIIKALFLGLFLTFKKSKVIIPK